MCQGWGTVGYFCSVSLAEQQQVRSSFINPVLAQQVAQALKVVEARKEQGVKPERIWFVERQETGTLCIAEWMGF